MHELARSIEQAMMEIKKPVKGFFVSDEADREEALLFSYDHPFLSSPARQRNQGLTPA
jgi:hypothetical protein